MKNKTLLKLLLCSLIGAVSLGIGACGGDNDGDGVISATPPAVEVEEASLSLNMKKVTLPLFGRATIVATLKNSTEAIVWATSDASVVTVQNGELYGCKEGTATITVTAGELVETCTVTVTKEGVVTQFAMLEDGMTLYLGAPYKLDPTVVSNGVTVEGLQVTFTTEGDVFTLDEAGNVTALKEGTQDLTATAKLNGETILTETFTVHIREYLSVRTGIDRNDLRLKLTNYHAESLTEFALSQCKAVIGTETRDDITVSYTVEDSTVVKIEDGKILPLQAGNTVVTMSFTSPNTGNVYTGNINVSVEKEVIEKQINFLAKSATGTGKTDFQNDVTGVTPIDLTGAGIDLTTFVAVREKGKTLTAFPSGNTLNVTDASCGEVVLEVELDKVIYTIDGFIAQTLISNKAELQKFYSTYGTVYGYTVLTADIDMGGDELNGGGQWFRCIFDGRGHTISNFTTKYGIVTYISEGAHIKNVQFVNVVKDAGEETTFGGEDIGSFGLFGYSHTGSVSDVFIAGTIKNPAKKQAVFSGGEYSQAYYKNIIVAFDVVGAGEDTELIGTGGRYSGTGTNNRFENVRYIYDGEMKACADYPDKKDAICYKTVAEYLQSKSYNGLDGYWQTSETTLPAMSDLSEYFENAMVQIDGVLDVGETLLVSTTMACAEITLKAPVNGIALDGETLTISESVALGTSFTLVFKSSLNETVQEKTFTIRKAETLAYTGKYVDAMNGQGKLVLSKLAKEIGEVQSVTIDGIEKTCFAENGILYYDTLKTGVTTLILNTESHAYTVEVLQADNVITTGDQFSQWIHKDKGNFGSYQYTVLANDITITMTGKHYMNAFPQGRVFDGLGYTIDGFTSGMGIVRYLDGGTTTWKNVNYTNYSGDLVFYQFLGGIFENVSVKGTVSNTVNLLAYTINRSNTVIKNCVVDVKHPTAGTTLNIAGKGAEYSDFTLIDTKIIFRNGTITTNNVDMSKGSNYEILDSDDIVEAVDTNYYAKVSGGNATFSLSQMGENAPTTVSKLLLDDVEVQASVANGNLTYPATATGDVVLEMHTDKGVFAFRIVHADNVISTWSEYNAWALVAGGGYNSYEYTVLVNDITAPAGVKYTNGGHFQKTFDGLGHTIDGFTCGHGIVQRALSGSVWKNVNYTNLTTTGQGLFGYMAGGSFENITISGKIGTMEKGIFTSYGINTSMTLVDCTFTLTSDDNAERYLYIGDTCYYGVTLVNTTVNYTGKINTKCDKHADKDAKITLTNSTLNSNYKAQ